jgi:hypothetical protein
MKFECKELSIDNAEIGCSVTFYDKKGEYTFGKEQTVAEMVHSLGKYIILQRTYAEDEFEEDYYYFETNDFEKSGELNTFNILLTKTEFILTIENEKYEIQINTIEKEWNELKEALIKLTEKKGQLNIK